MFNKRVKELQELLKLSYETIKSRDIKIKDLTEELNAVRPGHWEYLVTYWIGDERHVVADGYVKNNGSIAFFKNVTRYRSRTILQIWRSVKEIECIRVTDEEQ